jgi:hypothetical protein
MNSRSETHCPVCRSNAPWHSTGDNLHCHCPRCGEFELTAHSWLSCNPSWTVAFIAGLS